MAATQPRTAVLLLPLALCLLLAQCSAVTTDCAAFGECALCVAHVLNATVQPCRWASDAQRCVCAPHAEALCGPCGADCGSGALVGNVGQCDSEASATFGIVLAAVVMGVVALAGGTALAVCLYRRRKQRQWRYRRMQLETLAQPTDDEPDDFFY